MEIRVLQYFLAVAREENISKAASSLHISQPALSRQLKELEEELGKTLFVRGSRKISLTEEGMILRKRAEEIIDLVTKTEKEISYNDDDILQGDITIGAGETVILKLITPIIKDMQENHPDVHFHIVSGDGKDVIEYLERGLIDFGMVFEPYDISKYNSILLPQKDDWGLLVPKDDPISSKSFIALEDLRKYPLILSRQVYQSNGNVLGIPLQELHVVGTINLVFNASLMVEEHIGYNLTLNHLINTKDSNLVFIPIEPKQSIQMYFVWKKYQILSKPAKKFLESILDKYASVL